MRLRTRLLIFFLLLALLPLVAVGYLSFVNGRIAVQDVTINHLVSTNLAKYSEMNRWIEAGKTTMNELAQRPLVRQLAAVLSSEHEKATAGYVALKTSLVEDHLIPGLEYGRFLQISLLCPTHGIVLASTDPLQEGKYRDSYQYYSEGKTGTFVQGVYYATTDEQVVMTISTPVTDKVGNLAGVLACNLDLRELSDIMSKTSGLSSTEDTYLVNNFNFFVTEPHFGLDYAMKKTVRTAGINSGLSGGDGIGYYTDYRGEPVIGAYKWLPEYNMCIITEIDQSEAYAPIVRLGGIIGIIAIIIGAGVTMLAFLFARNITQPLNALVDGARKIGSGNLGYKVGNKSRDEIGDLSRAFDDMTEQMKSTTVSRDELEQRVIERTAQLADANKEMEAFAYSVSHDLRAPLRSVTGYSRILVEDFGESLNEEGKRICSTIVQSAERMGGLIDDLLTLSRTSRAEMELSRIDMGTMANSVFHELSLPGEIERIDFRVNSVMDAAGDPSLIRQVWMNLISNAIKFTSKLDRVNIQVGSQRNGGEIIYSVRDNGVGFDMQYVNKLFGVFQRLHGMREFEGNGVGLAIVQRVIHRHGGRVWAIGEINKGATFYFTIPDNGG